jgi:hypothetical protein
MVLAAQSKYPAPVMLALTQTSTNREQLVKALDYFYQGGDSIKVKSIDFLVANMPLHASSTYYWADSAGRRLPFNELDYPNFDEAVSSFNRLKAKYGRIHPVAYSYRDIDSVKADMLIRNVELATDQYRRQGNTTWGDDFFEFVLPYRADVEPLENWRAQYAIRFDSTFNKEQGQEAQLKYLKVLENRLFQNEWGVESRTEPQPRLGAMQILFRQKGYCEDMADMATFIARSRGVAATVDNIPAWATASGNHFLDFIKKDDRTPAVHFDAVLDSLGREPSKVLRSTFSAQADALASWLDTASIPRGYLRLSTYRDVTQEYWPVDTLSAPLFTIQSKGKAFAPLKVAFMAVLNSGRWQPIWYGKIKGSRVYCNKMTKGVVYLPMYYINQSMVPAGWPFALGYHNRQVLRPDTLQTHSVTLAMEEKYLKYQTGKKYRLLFWNNRWQLLGEQTAPENCTRLTFDHVPSNALLLLIPEYSQGKERPFMILENGERVWW